MTLVNETIKLLQNALDCDAMSEFHSGYTAREIHRKSIACLKQCQKQIEDLEASVSLLPPKYVGWSTGKDE